MLSPEELEKLQEFGKIFEHSDDIVALSDGSGKLLYINKSGRKFLKIEDNLNELPFCFNAFHCTILEQIPEYCPGKELPAERIPNLFQMITKVGDEFFKLNCTPVYNGAKELRYIVHIAKNETESYKRERKLLHTNSLLKAIRNFNQFIFVERVPDRILDEACQILYQTQNYIFVGLLTAKDTPFEKDVYYYSKYNIELKDFDNNQIEIYLHFKEKAEELIKIYAKLPQFERKVEIHEGIYENEKFIIISIPIFYKKLNFGHLVVSSTQFQVDEEEIAFLQEFADDLALALYSIFSEQEKEKLEDTVRERERFYYTLLSNLPGFVYRCRNDRYWTMEYLSDNFYKITGYRPEEVIGNKVLSFNDLIHKDHQERLWVKWQILLRKRQVFEDEYPIVTKSGEIRWVYEQGRGVYDENGNVVALEGYITDITPRKKLEEQIIESERKYRALFEESADGIFLMSADTFIDCNLSALKMFRCERKDIIGKPPYEFSPPFQPDGQPSKKKVIELINRAYKGETIRFEWLHKTLDGVEFECEVSLNKISYGKKSYILAIVRNISEQKKSYYEILKFAKALDSIGEAVCITDLSNRFIYVNKAFENLYGYSSEEILGKNFLVIRAQESLNPEIEKSMFEALSKNQVWRGELWNKDKNGRKFKVILTSNTIWDEAGKPIGYVGVAIDLTERIKMQKALEESEERFRTLVSSMDDIVYTLDTQHRHNGIFGKWAQNYGLTEETFLGKTALEILGEEEGKIHIEMQERCLKGESIVYEWSRTLGKDTFYFQTHISPIRNSKGEIIGIVGIVRDITKLKKLELDLVKFYQIVEQTPTGVFILEPDERITFVNRSLGKILDVNRNEIVNHKISQIHSKIFPENYFKELINKVEKQGAESIEVNIKTKKSNEIWVKILFFPIFNDNGQLVNLVGLLNDITKEKEYIAELKRAKEKAEELSALKTYLLMNFSHEFRTPLNGILGWSQVLKEERNEPEIQEIANYIFQSGTRLLETVNSLIDYSRIETGFLKIQASVFDVVDTVREITNSLKEQFKDKNLLVKFQSETDSIIIETDEYLVRAIVHAIVHNAFKFTRQGEINIILHKKMDENNLEQVEIVVSDTGIGIPEDQIDLIWTDFYQVSQGLSREFEGQGLGLSIAKKFIEKLNGKIFVKSELGKGSTFTIVIPANYSDSINTTN